MTICRVCKKKLIGYGYTVHHGNYHLECLKKKFPYAEGDGAHVILYWNIDKKFELRESSDKLEGIIWYNISEMLETKPSEEITDYYNNINGRSAASRFIKPDI